MIKNATRFGAFAAMAFAVATSASVSAETFNNWVEVGEDRASRLCDGVVHRVTNTCYCNKTIRNTIIPLAKV